MEDDPTVAMDLKEILTSRLYHVSACVTTGEEAIETFRRKTPDLLLVDIVLAGAVDGVEAVRRIHRLRYLPVVYLTAHDEEGTLRRAMETSPMAFISKPYSTAQIYSSVEIALARSKKAEEWPAVDVAAAMDAVPLPLILVRQDGSVLHSNRFAKSWIDPTCVLNGRGKSLLTKPSREPCRHCRLCENVASALSSGSSKTFTEAAIPAATGTASRLFSIAIVPFSHNSESLVMISFQDVTKDQRTTSELWEKLRVQETALRESHHRIKNNLQLFSSLVSLESRESENPELRRALRMLNFRVRAIAAAHDALQLAAGGRHARSTHLISSLVNLFVSTTDVERRGIAVSAHVADIPLPHGRAVPCALLVNELVTNAVEHAFPGDRKGAITVSLQRQGEFVELCVSDDGVGLPEGLRPSEASSLGFRLLHSLTDQIDGEITIQNDEGTRVCIVFPAKD